MSTTAIQQTTTDDSTTDQSESLHGIYHSKLYHDWYDKVASGKPNDFIMAVTADPRSTGVSGTGKTTLGGSLGKNVFDHSDDGFDAEVNYTLDASVLAYDAYPATGPMATLIYDEAQGTPATTGLNSKRAMKSESIDAINAIATGRSERKTVIIISQSIKSIVNDLYDYLDAWLLIRDEINYVASHYKVHPDVFNFERNKITTPKVEDITWEAMGADDPDYQIMERKKSAAKRGNREFTEGGDDEDEDDDPNRFLDLNRLADLPKAKRDENIRILSDMGVEQSTIAERADLTQTSVSRIIGGTQ